MLDFIVKYERERMMIRMAELLDKNSTVLVEFYAKWCPHCQNMMPVIEELKGNKNEEVNVQTYDIDDPANRSLLDYYRIQSVPTMLLFKDREQVWRQSGEMNYPRLNEVIERYR